MASLSLVARFSQAVHLSTSIAGWTAWSAPPWGRPRPIWAWRAPRRPRARPPGSGRRRGWWRGEPRPPAPRPHSAHAQWGRWRGAPSGSECAGREPGPRRSSRSGCWPRRGSASSSSSLGEASFARQPESKIKTGGSCVVLVWLTFCRPDLNIPWLFVRTHLAPRSGDSSKPLRAEHWWLWKWEEKL